MEMMPPCSLKTVRFGSEHVIGKEVDSMAAQLIVMRHGESVWTQKSVNRFAGWVDVPLTERGLQQARHAGQLLRQSGLLPDLVFTSLLTRSIITANIVLDLVDRAWIPVERTWRLNERHYGAFQGQTRPAMLERYGQQQFGIYRRSYDVRPPAIETDSLYFQGQDPRYAPSMRDGLDRRNPAEIRAECLKDLLARLHPYWRSRIAPSLAQGRTVLIVTHGSVVRSLIKVLEKVDDKDIRSINVPTGVPLVYSFETDKDGNPKVQGPGRYLDQEAANQGMAETAALGR